ncbi:MAG: hypothetical protein KGI73_01775 [Patescibacteria group bacterium]|nr:hypothetical protein [Patescibacteria group bacterium]
MGAAITFFVSLVLLVVFVGFRFFEERRGFRVWMHLRTQTDAFVAEAYKGAVTGNIPSEYREALVHFLHRLAHDLVVTAVLGLRAIERPLMRLSYRMRRAAPKANGKEPSAFLKTITPEKRGGEDSGVPPSEKV